MQPRPDVVAAVRAKFGALLTDDECGLLTNEVAYRLAQTDPAWGVSAKPQALPTATTLPLRWTLCSASWTLPTRNGTWVKADSTARLFVVWSSSFVTCRAPWRNLRWASWANKRQASKSSLAVCQKTYRRSEKPKLSAKKR